MKTTISTSTSSSCASSCPSRNCYSTCQKKKRKMSFRRKVWTKEMDKALLEICLNLVRNSNKEYPWKTAPMWQTATKNLNNLINERGWSNCGPMDWQDLGLRMIELEKEYKNVSESPMKSLVIALFFDLGFKVPSFLVSRDSSSRSPTLTTTDRAGPSTAPISEPSINGGAAPCSNDLHYSTTLYNKFSNVLMTLNIPQETIFDLMGETTEKQRQILVAMKDSQLQQLQAGYVARLMEGLKRR